MPQTLTPPGLQQRVRLQLDELLRKLGPESAGSFRDLAASFVDDSIDVEARTVKVAWASEEPYERYFGAEVLDCAAPSVRLGRLANGAALLFNHGRDNLIGVVESVTLGSDRVCRALVRFDTSDEAEKRFQQVRNKVLTKVSVGYFVHAMVLEKEEGDTRTYRVTDWEPFELSFVTVPADDSVGVGRSLEPGAAPPQPQADQRDTTTPTEVPPTVPVQLKETRAMPQALENQPANPSAESIDIKRREALVDLGVKYADYVTLTEVRDYCTGGKTPNELQELVIQRMTTKHSDTRGAHIGMSERDVGQYSIAKAVRGMLTGEWKEAGLEREASAAAATKFSMSTKGLLIPYDVTARRDFNVTTAANEAAPLVTTDLRTDLLVDILRNRLAIGRLGATMLYGLSANIDIPKKLTGTSLGFVTEIAALAKTNITTGKISMSPKRIGGYIEYSKQAVIQSAIAVEPLLRRDILDQYALEVETAAFNGSGSGANPRGLRNTSGVGLVVGGTNGAQPNWGHIVGLETAVADVNCDPDATSGYLLNTRARGWFKTQQKAANLPFIWDNGGTPLNGYRAEVSNLVPRNLTKGTAVGTCSNITFGCDWNSLIVGTFGAMELLIDETSQAVNGLNRLILNAFIDVGVRRAADFAMMEDAIAQ